jgi:dTDP-4-dehydrorhamnose 3,5-epimerase
MTVSIQSTDLEGVKVITTSIHRDVRGFFSELYNAKDLKELGIQIDFCQENHSFSKYKNTLRGLHMQSPPYAQTKLVRCGRGSFLDIFVDIRKNSPTYMQWGTQKISFANKKQILIPEGFLHGFLTLSDNTEIIYKCSSFYSIEHEVSVAFNDPELSIDWGLDSQTHLYISDKDRNASLLRDIINPY